MTAAGQAETCRTTEVWSACDWIADTQLTRVRFFGDSVLHCRNPPSTSHSSRPSNFHARIAPNNALTLSRIDWL